MVKKIIWLVIITAILIYSVPKLLEQLSLMFDRAGEDTASQSQEESVIFPPVVDSVPTATNTASIRVTGYAENAKEVEIYVNDILKETANVRLVNNSFSTTVPLFQGSNTLTLVSYDEEDNKSDPTDPIYVSYIAEGPDLIIDSPLDDEEIKGEENRTIDVRGITEPDVTVTVNERWVFVSQDGSFSHPYRLDDGDNELEIVAKDSAGNTTEVTRNVRYSE